MRTEGGTVESVRQLRLHVSLAEASDGVDPLVERARSGDLVAFEQLAERSMPEAYRLAAAIVGPDDARDVTQDSLLAAWRELPNLRQAARFDSWLRSIVMNRARNALRSRKRHPTVALIETHPGGPIEEPMGATHQRLALESAFGEVPLEQREVLVLHYLLDLPLREVAATLRIPEGTAKSRLHAGLRVLRTGLGER